MNVSAARDWAAGRWADEERTGMRTLLATFCIVAAAMGSLAQERTEAPAQASHLSRTDKNRILIQLAESPRSHYGKVAYEKQSKAQQVFSAVWGLESEVNNGGFAQYFENSAGGMAVDTEAWLRAIGARRAAEIVAEAVALFPGGPPPRDHDARQQRLAGASAEVRAAWDRLDQEFFKYPDDLTSLLYAWIKAHPKDFGAVP
jgi:hypothetical protein